MKSSERLRKKYTITRTEGQYVNGRYVEGSSTQFSIKATIQPFGLNENSLSFEESGNRDSEQYHLFTNSLLFVNNENTTDSVIIHGDKFVVTGVFYWGNGLLENCQYIVSKETAI